MLHILLRSNPRVRYIRFGVRHTAEYHQASDDQLHSYAAQVKFYSEKFIGSETEELIDIYADEGISGTGTAKRTEFQRLIRDCKRGKIDRIYAKSLSRFARNTKDCLNIVRLLRELGISIYFEKENIDTANGEEYKNCRKHLISHLEGNIAWLHPEDAIRQRKRIKAERITAREQRAEPVREVQQQPNNVPDEVIEPQENEREPILEDEDLEQEEAFEMTM